MNHNKYATVFKLLTKTFWCKANAPSLLPVFCAPVEFCSAVLRKCRHWNSSIGEIENNSKLVDQASF